ncbi:hypothetical protein [Paraburkholderia mimosarum]|uniref:hypothetical protein n=1 Tax=Paraburkholderia mimosarum TaxID=312026 RepID=UPI0012B6349C|nr:hypothetical protein [Paraburkholderia mimosarum]
MTRDQRRPTGMRSRPARNGTVTYYVLTKAGRRISLGKDFTLACVRWVHHRKDEVKHDPPATAIALLDAFVLCSLPQPNEQAANWRSFELNTLRDYFTGCGNPGFDAITGEKCFLNWCKRENRVRIPDGPIRLLRRVWKFALELDLTKRPCPWSPVDLRHLRVTLEAVDVLSMFATGSLRQLLLEILGSGDSDGTTTGQSSALENEGSLAADLLVAIDQATSSLRASGRAQLVPRTASITPAELFTLLQTPEVELARPPGRLLLEHRRLELKKALNSDKRTASKKPATRPLTGERESADPSAPVEQTGRVSNNQIGGGV